DRARASLVPFQLVRANEGEMGAEALVQIPFPRASFQKPFPSLCVSNVDGGFVVHEDERASRGGGSNTTCPVLGQPSAQIAGRSRIELSIAFAEQHVGVIHGSLFSRGR